MTLKETETFIEHDIIFDGTKVGELELCPTSHEISRLVIFEPYQNKGYGTKVVKELVLKGYTKLWVRSDNPKAIHVYEKCGFRFGENVMHEMVYEEPKGITDDDAEEFFAYCRSLCEWRNR